MATLSTTANPVITAVIPAYNEGLLIGSVWSHPNPVKELCYPDVLRFVTIRRPVTAFGIPGLIILIIGVFLAYQALVISVETGAWSPTITLVSMMMLMMGMLLCCVAVILYAVAQMILMVSRD